MPRDRTQEAFLKAIEADPREASPRLIYADWLTENRFDDEADEQRFLASLLSDPYDSRLRAAYASWLDGQGRADDSRQQAWLAEAFSGKRFPAYEVYTRRTIPEKGYWARRLRELFEAHPEILVIVVGVGSFADNRFRLDRGQWKHNPAAGTRTRVGFKSPILYYRKATARSHDSNYSGAWVT
jgi:uncharacterized protein (TIGR02996 family)